MTNSKTKEVIIIVILLLSSIFLLTLYYILNTSGYLSFSDGAKFADIARNIAFGDGYKASFSFFSPNIFRHAQGELFSARGVPLAMPYSIAAVFSIFGISDLSVIATSGLFYLGLVIATYALGRHLFGKLAGVLAALAIALNANYLDYATSGASEPLFALVVVATAYLILLKKKWASVLVLLGLFLLYFTRTQGVLFILGFAFMWLFINYSFKFAASVLVAIGVGMFLIDKYVLYPLSWKLPVYPIVTRGVQAFFQYSGNFAVSDALRGGASQSVNVLGLSKKVFFNIYNFYRLLPQIASPYLSGLFIISLFHWNKNRDENIFKLTTLILLVGTFLLAALTIPFFRYLHPIVPLVYIFSTAMLVWIVRQIFNAKYSILNFLNRYKFKIRKSMAVSLSSVTLLLIFVGGQTLGVIFLDSRFKAQRINKGEPPVDVQLSNILKENTSEEDIIITNLDTWGSWYGERNTIWYPLKPGQLEFKDFTEAPFDAIYLTSYLVNDENYFMGDEWRQVFENPQNPKDEFISNNYELKGIYKIESSETYEKQDAKAVLFVRKIN